MKRAASIQDAIQHTKGGYDVVPANIMLAGAEQELSQTGKEHRLKEAVAPVASDYDFIVIDTGGIDGTEEDGERLHLCHRYSDSDNGGNFCNRRNLPAQRDRYQRSEVLQSGCKSERNFVYEI